MIAIVIEYTAEPAHRAALEDVLRRNAAETLAEEGCLRMELAVSARDPGVLVLNELWRDERALEVHRMQPGHDEGHAAYEHMIAAKRVLKANLI